jgi:hypothetical protein
MARSAVTFNAGGGETATVDWFFIPLTWIYNSSRALTAFYLWFIPFFI